MYTKVMLALDGSEEPSQLVSTATQLMDEERGQMLVVHLTELTAGRGSGPLHVDEDDRIARVREQVARLKGNGIDAKLVIGSTVRNPADAIARVAEMTEADVIVTGRSGHGPVLGAIAGDTPKALLRRAPCPVLVVSPRSARPASGPRRGLSERSRRRPPCGGGRCRPPQPVSAVRAGRPPGERSGSASDNLESGRRDVQPAVSTGSLA